MTNPVNPAIYFYFFFKVMQRQKTLRSMTDNRVNRAISYIRIMEY